MRILTIVASELDKDLVLWIIFKMRNERPLRINLLLVHKPMGSNPIGELVVERELRLQVWLFTKCGRQVIVFKIERQPA